MTLQRVLTAVVLIPVVVGLVLKAPTSIVTLAVALVSLLALFEFFALGDAIGHRAYRFWTATCALLLVYVQYVAAIVPTVEFSNGLAIHREIGRLVGRLPEIADVLFIFMMGIALLSIFTRRVQVEALPAAGISCSGFLLIAFPLSFAIRIHGAGKDGPWLLLYTLVIVWASDTAAYFVGRAIGRFKLAPQLSPKKTWEGSLAGFIASMALAFLFERWLSAPLPQLLIVAALGNVAGQLGDLAESAYKRSAGVKDSGTLLPGHGGILDRIDALILAIPVVWYYWNWFYLPRM